MAARFTLLFTGIFLLTAWFSQIPHWLNLPPVSIHQWRQADGAALAWHYAQQPDFWQPSIFNLFENGDAHAVGELPLLYWLSGMLSKTFGFPGYPLRWIGLVLLYIGLWSFGWIMLRATRHPLLAALASGLLLTSPILNYYGPGFLPDAPAFCLVMVMAACLVRADERQSPGWVVLAGIFTVLAVLLKLSMAILPLALALIWILGKRRQVWRTHSLWQSHWPIWVMLGILLIVAGFRWWIAQYNAQHHTAYFLASTRPIWSYSPSFILETLNLFGRMALPVFISGGAWLFCLIAFYMLVKNWNQTAFTVRWAGMFSLLGSLGYFLLWFRMFREHDYYLLCLLILPAFLWWVSASLFSAKKMLLLLAGAWLLGLWQAGKVAESRLQLAFEPTSTLNLPPDAFLSDSTLTQFGIPPSARFLCPQDPSPNIALFALKRQGWTAYNFSHQIKADTLEKYCAGFGLTHLALRDSSLYGELYTRYFPEKIAVVRGWYLFGKSQVTPPDSPTAPFLK